MEVRVLSWAPNDRGQQAIAGLFSRVADWALPVHRRVFVPNCEPRRHTQTPKPIAACAAAPEHAARLARSSEALEHRAAARIIEIGISAGALKPTTGYGFLTMRNHALQIARALKTGNPLPRIYRKRRFRFYDALLLQMLEENPHRGKDIFERLFNKLPARLVLKFLDEKTAIWEEIRIFSQLQIAWFLKAVFQYAKR